MARINTSSMKVLTRKTPMRHIRTGDITQKIAATVVFNSELINQIQNEQKTRIRQVGLKMLATYFEAYVDNLARMNHSSFHHVYEPNRTGNKDSRLFESNITGNTLTYNFKPSQQPGDSGYVFENKAFVMENGIPITIRAKQAEYLKFEVDGNFVSKKQVYVSQPGGPDVKGSFFQTFTTFMTTNALDALHDLKFFERIEKGIQQESRVVLARVSAGKIEGMAKDAAVAANNITRRLERGL
jgi:hypothetical protein